MLTASEYWDAGWAGPVILAEGRRLEDFVGGWRAIPGFSTGVALAMLG